LKNPSRCHSEEPGATKNLSFSSTFVKKQIPRFAWNDNQKHFFSKLLGDCLAAKLRPGNVHSAEGWEDLLLPEIERQQRMGKEVAFRGDAAFAKPEVYEALEAPGVKYAIRISANDSLERDIAELLPRPVGRPSQKPLVEYKGLLYQAASWKTARRVVAKVEHHAGSHLSF